MKGARKHGMNHYGVPDKFTPFRDRRVSAKQVPCPICGAEIDQPCLKKDGTPGTNIHPRRRGIAIREGK